MVRRGRSIATACDRGLCPAAAGRALSRGRAVARHGAHLVLPRPEPERCPGRGIYPPQRRRSGGPAAGGAFYRDVAPGRYRISVDSYVQDSHNDADLVLGPGMEAYAKVLPLENFVQGGGGAVGGGFRRNSFVVWLYPPEIGRVAVANSYFTAGGS